MKSLWQDSARLEIHQRLAALTLEARPRWGRMSAGQMVAHAADAMGMAFGDLPVASKNLPIRYPPLKQLIVYWLPFPKSAPTAPELLERVPGRWQTDVAELEASIDRFATLTPQSVWPEHPAFGTLSSRAWGVLTYKHLDHHLRQFGV